MPKKLSRKTNFILIGIVVGLFVGVSIRQALGDTDLSGTVRADNLTVNTSRIAGNGLAVDFGNLLVPNGNVGIGTTTPTVKLDVVGDGLISGIMTIQNSERKSVGLTVNNGNILVSDGRIGVGNDPQEMIDVQGNMRAVGYIKADSLCIGNVDGACVGNSKKLCIGTTCIDETQLKAMMSGGTVPGGTATPGTMTGTGTTSDPYLCPYTYSVVGGGGENGCVNRPDVIAACCKSGSMTSCQFANGRVSIVGSGCTYTPPPTESHPAGTWGTPVSLGIQWFITSFMSLGHTDKSMKPIGDSCDLVSDGDFYLYEQTPPYYDENDNERPTAKDTVTYEACRAHYGLTPASMSGVWCYRAKQYKQMCNPI